MTEKAEKNKSGAGKFFLGAALGAAVGAIASKFIKFGDAEEEEEELEVEAEAKKTTPKKPETKPKKEGTK